MKWIRLYVTVEGQTEKEFADRLLMPHLANFAIDVRPRVFLTNRKLGKRGGIFNFRKIKGDVAQLMKQDTHPEARFTTMIDLYALPPEFPGWHQAQAKTRALDRVTVLESALSGEFGDDRFVPYIQLHEFETLLYCDLNELQIRLTGSASGITALKEEVRGMEPEAINEGIHTAPSKRIISHVPLYESSKVRVGAPAAAAIGLQTLREMCPHFAAWIATLEALEKNTG